MALSSWGLMSRRGVSVPWRTLSATLPYARRLSPERPRVDMAMRWKPSFSA